MILMSKKRLSKLQKWILKECLENLFFERDQAREFYGKKFSPGYNQTFGKGWEKKRDMSDYELFTREYSGGYKWEGYRAKKELFSTRAVEVSISRSLKSLITKGYLMQPHKWGRLHLTKKGFLKANKLAEVGGVISPSVNVKKSGNVQTFINLKTYKARVDEVEQQRRKAAKESSKRLRQQFNPSPERQKKLFEFKKIKEEFDKKFSPGSIFELCCEECKKKIVKFQKNCGIEEVNRLAEELKDIV